MSDDMGLTPRDHKLMTGKGPSATARCPECKSLASAMMHQPLPAVYTKFGCWKCGHIFTVNAKPKNSYVTHKEQA